MVEVDVRWLLVVGVLAVVLLTVWRVPKVAVPLTVAAAVATLVVAMLALT